MQNATTAQRRRGQIHWNQDYADVALGLAVTVFALVSAVRGQVRMDVLSVPLDSEVGDACDWIIKMRDGRIRDYGTRAATPVMALQGAAATA